MKSFLVFFFLILACGTSVIGWIFFRNKLIVHDISYSIEEKKENYSEQLISKQKQEELDSNLYNKAIEKRDSTICQKITESIRKNDCRDMLTAMNAIETNDVNLCSTIANKEIVSQCKDRISLKLAEEKQDSKICESITNTGSRNYCRETIDQEKLNAEMENGSITSEFCKTLENKSQTVCNEALLQKETQKTYTKAVQNGDSASCDLIPLESERTLCLDTLMLRKAVTESDIGACESIISADKKSYCKSTLAKSSESELFKQYVSTNNLAGCKNLSEVSIKNKCNDSIILSLARTNKDQSLCNNLTNTGMLLNCQKLAQ